MIGGTISAPCVAVYFQLTGAQVGPCVVGEYPRPPRGDMMFSVARVLVWPREDWKEKVKSQCSPGHLWANFRQDTKFRTHGDEYRWVSQTLKMDPCNKTNGPIEQKIGRNKVYVRCKNECKLGKEKCTTPLYSLEMASYNERVRDAGRMKLKIDPESRHKIWGEGNPTNY